jgi:hypothetical protein
MDRAFLLLSLLFVACTAHKIAGARLVIADQSKCPEPEIFVRELSQGYLGEGCGQSWMCSGASGPCSKLSCEQVAQQERFSCRDNAEREASYGRNNVEIIVKGISAQHLLDQCTAQYDEAVRKCAAKPSETAPPPPAKTSASL